MPPSRIHLVAAARPNFMKVAPLYHALREAPDFTPSLIHTGQHYDVNLSERILADLGIQTLDFQLGVGSGSHAAQTAAVMVAYEKLAEANPPDWLVVAGDVNSTVACALVAAKLRIPLVHLEAGLRSGDRTMPEEINRLVTDVLADVLWTPSSDADENLRAEGIDPSKITRVGNIMLDSFEMVRPAIERELIVTELGLTHKGYGLVTLHRPSNVDDVVRLRALVEGLTSVQRRLPLVFPVHPRTAQRLAESRLDVVLTGAGVRLIEPLSYVRFMGLVVSAGAVITDSGGVQEETTYLGVPCLTLRENTERPITISEGTNRLVGIDALGGAIEEMMAINWKPRRPEFWDGRTALRCVADLRDRSG